MAARLPAIVFAAALLGPAAALSGLPRGAQPRRLPARTRAAPACAIAVFGATGGVGSEAAFQALARGESVVALCRDPSRLLVPAGSGGAAAGSALQNPKLTVTTGTVTSDADVAATFDAAGAEGARARAGRTGQGEEGRSARRMRAVERGRASRCRAGCGLRVS